MTDFSKVSLNPFSNYEVVEKETFTFTCVIYSGITYGAWLKYLLGKIINKTTFYSC